MDKNLRYSKIQSFSNCGLSPANSESPRMPFSDGCDERPPFPIECLWWGWGGCIVTTDPGITSAHKTLRTTEACRTLR